MNELSVAPARMLGGAVILDPETGKPKRKQSLKIHRVLDGITPLELARSLSCGAVEMHRIKGARPGEPMFMVLPKSPKGGGRQFFEEALTWATADGTAIANTTTETIIWPNITIPGTYMADGRILKLHGYGRHSTTATPTITAALRWNGAAGTILCQTGALTAGSTVTAAPWFFEITLQTRLNGAAGSLFATGQAFFWDDAVGSTGSATNAPGIAFMGSAGAATPAAVTVDLTADTPLAITGKWSAASASNTLTGHNYVTEGQN